MQKHEVLKFEAFVDEFEKRSERSAKNIYLDRTPNTIRRSGKTESKVRVEM